jgi:radical SAM protein with 4Fe4S-binding SPASM domain
MADKCYYWASLVINNMKRIQEENRVPLEPRIPLTTPFVINVDPSSSCNFKCKFCYHSNNRMKKQGIMNWDTYKKIISDIKKFDAPLKTLRLYAFGEPMLNPRFADMVKYAKDASVSEKIDTTTNGSILNPKLNLEIINAGIDRINISVNGVNKEQYENFSNYKIDFDDYVRNITHLYENRKDCIIFIKINGDVLLKEDQDKFLKIFTPISTGIAIEHVMNCWYGFEMEKIEINKKVGVYGQPLKEVEICPYIFYSFCIQYDGQVSACFLDWNRELIIGDIHNRSVKELWNSTKLNNLRKFMLKKQRDLIPICKSCQQLVAGQPENLDKHAEDILNRYEMSNMFT